MFRRTACAKINATYTFLSPYINEKYIIYILDIIRYIRDVHAFVVNNGVSAEDCHISEHFISILASELRYSGDSVFSDILFNNFWVFCFNDFL